MPLIKCPNIITLCLVQPFSMGSLPSCLSWKPEGCLQFLALSLNFLYCIYHCSTDIDNQIWKYSKNVYKLYRITHTKSYVASCPWELVIVCLCVLKTRYLKQWLIYILWDGNPIRITAYRSSGITHPPDDDGACYRFLQQLIRSYSLLIPVDRPPCA